MTNTDLQQLSNDFFQNSLDSSPTSAIMRGHKKYFDQIEELNEETFEKEAKAVNDFISRLKSLKLESLSHIYNSIEESKIKKLNLSKIKNLEEINDIILEKDSLSANQNIKHNISKEDDQNVNR